MRAASRVPTVFGLAGLLVALAFLGGNAGTVMAALNAETTNTVSATGATWSVVVNGTSGAKVLAVATSGGAATTFTINNNGNTNITGMTVTISITGNRTVRVCQNSGPCNSGGSTVTQGTSPLVIAAPTSIPTTAGTSVTWSMRRTTSGGSASANVSVAVTSNQIAAGTATNG